MAALGRRYTLLALAVLAASACEQPEPESDWAAVGRTCTDDAPATPLAQAIVDTLPAFDTLGSHFGRRWWLARNMPGRFAGLAVVDGKTTLFLTDTSQAKAALAFSREHGIDGTGLTDDTPVQQARWDFAQLFDWYRYVAPHLKGQSLTSLGIDEGRNRIEFAVPDIDAQRHVEIRLAELHLPCFLIAVPIIRRPTAANP